MTDRRLPAALFFVVLGFWVGGCAGNTAPRDEHAAVVMQRQMLASRREQDVIAWYMALANTDPEEDPHLWVQAAQDGSRGDLQRTLCFQALADRFFRKADVRELSTRLHIESWWDPARFAESGVLGGQYPAGFRVPKGAHVYVMKLPGPPLRDREAADQRFIDLAIAPSARAEEVWAAARGESGARAFVVQSVGLAWQNDPVAPGTDFSVPDEQK